MYADHEVNGPDAGGARRPISRATWVRITDLFGELLDLGDAERGRFLQRLRDEDPDTASELRSLLDEHERPGEFLPEIALAPPPLADMSGRTIDTYRLIRLIGAGGMGAVYLGERSDGVFSRHVAVKLLSLAFLQARERFHHERELLARLNHPNIARLLDGGETADGFPFLVLEFVDGIPIDTYCERHGLGLDARLALLLQVCAGVAHAHQNLIVHRDIKPENILVTADGGVKLLDFGIAKILDSAAPATLWRPATPAYSSPEQLHGDPVTTASDVYSIGVLAFVLLTGRLPYELQSGRLDEILHAVLNAEPLRASQACSDPARARRLRGDLDTVLARAIAKEPRRRYATVQQFADDLQRHRDGFPVSARPDTVTYRVRKFVGRYRVASALALITVVCLGAGIGISTWQARVAQRRFDDLRQFAHTIVFDVNDALATLPGTTAARKLVVETALRYLDRLSADDVADPALREELAEAYIRIGTIQGGAFLANLGDTPGAIVSFRKAVTAAGDPTTGGLRRRIIDAHINLGRLAVDPRKGTAEFDAAIAAMDTDSPDRLTDVELLRLMADAWHGHATADHLTDRVDSELAMSRREIVFRQRILQLAPGHWRDELDLSGALAQQALALEQSADYAASSASLLHSRAILEAAVARNPGNQILVRALAEKRSRAGSVLTAMGRPADGAREIEAAIAILSPLAAADPNDVQYRRDLGYAWFRLGEALRGQGETARALEQHRQALAVRRERATRDPAFTFNRWEVSRSLNKVAALVLDTAPAGADDAAAMFEEARRLAAESLTVAPSFNELRKEVARAQEGLARAAMAAGRDEDAARHLARSLETWRETEALSAGDRQDAEAPARVERLLASLTYSRSPDTDTPRR